MAAGATGGGQGWIELVIYKSKLAGPMAQRRWQQCSRDNNYHTHRVQHPLSIIDASCTRRVGRPKTGRSANSPYYPTRRNLRRPSLSLFVLDVGGGSERPSYEDDNYCEPGLLWSCEIMVVYDTSIIIVIFIVCRARRKRFGGRWCTATLLKVYVMMTSLMTCWMAS